MEEELKDLTRDLVEFLNENGLYQHFLSFMEQRGYDVDMVESQIDNLDE